MNNPNKLLEEGLIKCRQLQKRFPKLSVLDSIANQIEYLKSVIEVESFDRGRLSEIIIGVQTAREVETLDMESAEIFYQISELAKSLNHRVSQPNDGLG